eukprot:7386013-Prymnesium_polylepis.1
MPRWLDVQLVLQERCDVASRMDARAQLIEQLRLKLATCNIVLGYRESQLDDIGVADCLSLRHSRMLQVEHDGHAFGCERADDDRWDLIGGRGRLGGG